MMLSSIAKAVVGAAVTAGAAYAGAHGIPVPVEFQSWVTDAVMIGIAGLIGGSAVWATPNAPAVKKNLRKDK